VYAHSSDDIPHFRSTIRDPDGPGAQIKNTRPVRIVTDIVCF